MVSKAIAKHAFIGWLVILKSTKERMLHWGFSGDTKCVICRSRIEHRDMEECHELVLSETP